MKKFAYIPKTERARRIIESSCAHEMERIELTEGVEKEDTEELIKNCADRWKEHSELQQKFNALQKKCDELNIKVLNMASDRRILNSVIENAEIKISQQKQVIDTLATERDKLLVRTGALERNDILGREELVKLRERIKELEKSPNDYITRLAAERDALKDGNYWYENALEEQKRNRELRERVRELERDLTVSNANWNATNKTAVVRGDRILDLEAKLAIEKEAATRARNDRDKHWATIQKINEQLDSQKIELKETADYDLAKYSKIKKLEAELSESNNSGVKLMAELAKEKSIKEDCLKTIHHLEVELANARKNQVEWVSGGVSGRSVYTVGDELQIWFDNYGCRIPLPPNSFAPPIQEGKQKTQCIHCGELVAPDEHECGGMKKEEGQQCNHVSITKEELGDRRMLVGHSLCSRCGQLYHICFKD